MQNTKSIIFFSRKFCFAALLPARPIDPAPNSRVVPIVSCAVRRSRSQYRSQYRSPVQLVPVHRTSSSFVGHQFVVVQVRPLAPVTISIRSRNARVKLAKEDARCFSYRVKWWRREGKPREEKKKAREVEPRIP